MKGNKNSYNKNSTPVVKKVDNSLITEDFKKYEDKSIKKIKDKELEKMGQTLGIDIYSDIFITYFFYKCQCKIYGEVTVEEYTRGLSAFGVNTLAELKSKIIQVKEDLLNIHSDDFKKFYQFLFTFNLEIKTNKYLNFEIYELYFKELFSYQFKLQNEFLEYMEKVKSSTKISEDQWNLFLDLMKVIGDQFPKGYNVDEAWPSLFDEFYVWFCKKYDIKIEQPEY